MKSQENLNLDNYWLPFTANKNFKANPRLLTSASGMYYKTDDIMTNYGPGPPGLVVYHRNPFVCL